MNIYWWGAIPFAILLACIAVLPLIPAAARIWEQLRIQLAFSLGLGLPVALWMTLGGERLTVVHALVEYGQFIALLGALFVVSGGIFLAGDIRASPRNNTAFLAVGGLLASFIGTTGAAMLLIRPLLNTNSERRNRSHTVVFCIFIVANCGGLLTPLGDPPLFLGMLRGVPFTWTFGLWPEWLFVNILLLATYYGVDRGLYAQEPVFARRLDDSQIIPLGIKGKGNFAHLSIILAAVAFAPSLDLHAIENGHATAKDWIPWREIIMLGVATASYRTGDKTARFTHNKFTWAPILEVAALFIGIFLTMMPALNYLSRIAPNLPLNEISFFLFTGGLSSVLDNAPTYVTFFEMAQGIGGSPAVAGVRESYLVAISLGAVLCGAITYVGNGPNFMVKAVAESAGVPMPSFGGYIRYAVTYLVPVLAAMVLLFIADSTGAHVAGLSLTAMLLSCAYAAGRSPLVKFVSKQVGRPRNLAPNLGDEPASNRSAPAARRIAARGHSQVDGQ